MSGYIFICRYESVLLPLKIIATPHSTISPMCMMSLLHLIEILLAEEKESYHNKQMYILCHLFTYLLIEFYINKQMFNG
jgi:hypothetical protein